MSFATAAADRKTKRFMGFSFGDIPGIPSSYTDLRVATEALAMGSNYYQAVLKDHSNMSAEMRQGAPIARVSDITLRLKNAQMSGQPVGADLFDLLESHDFYGVSVTAQLICQDSDGTWNAQTVWYGNVTEWERNDTKKELTIRAAAMLDLEAAIPATVITQATHADPPDSSVGVCEPLVYGNLDAEEANPATNYLNNRRLEAMGYAGLSGAWPAICYDKASDDPSANVKFRAAGHDLKVFDGVYASHGAFYYVEELKQLAPLISANFTNGAGVADLELDLSGAEEIIAVHIDPQWVNGTYNTATNPEQAMNRSIANYATVDPSNPMLVLDVSKPPDLGYISAVRVYTYCAYDLSNGVGCYMDCGILNANTGTFVNWTRHTGGTSAGVVLTHSWSGCPTYADRFSASEHYAVTALLVNHAPGDYVHVWATAMVVEYYPRKILPREDWERTYTPIKMNDGPFGTYNKPTGYTNTWEKIPPDEYLSLADASSKILVVGEGKADDGAGTVTGSANSLIESPADILHDAFRNEASITSIATGGHGNMQTAGDDQATDNIEMAFTVNARTTARNFAQRICRQSGMGLFQVQTDGDYGLIYWGSGSATNDYGTPIDYDDVLDLKIGKTSIGDVKNDLHVDYGYSHATRKYTRHAYQDKDGDDDGDGGSAHTSTADFTTSESRYGKRAWNLKLDLIHDIESACKVRNIYADMLVEPRVTIRMRLPWKYYDVQLGHLIEMDDTSFRVDNNVRYPGSLSGSYYGYWSQGANHHYFWVERITYDKRGFMEIEATEGVF